MCEKSGLHHRPLSMGYAFIERSLDCFSPDDGIASMGYRNQIEY